MAQVRTRVVKEIGAGEGDRAGVIALPGISVEVALYAVLVVVAGLLRLYALGRQPLEQGEAEIAWSVWRFYRGQAGAGVLSAYDPASGVLGVQPTIGPNSVWPAATGVTHAPLLFFGSVLAFLVFDAGDVAARLVPAIFGVALVALPYFFRRQLGRWGALAASVLFVVSPSVVVFSRSLSPAIPAVATALAFVAALFGYLETREMRYMHAAAVALALSLAAGPAVYTVLLSLAVFALIVVAADRWGLTGSVSEAATSPGKGERSDYGSRLSRDESRDRLTHHGSRITQWAMGNGQSAIGNRQSLRSLALFAATFILVSTGFLADYRGLQASLDLFAHWLRGFVPGGGPGSSYVLQVLLSYELLALVFGIIGAVYFIRRRNPFAAFLTVWFGLALLVHSVGGAREPADVLVILVPLVLLAGALIGRLLEAVAENATLETEGFLALLICAVSGFFYFRMAGYVARGLPGFARLSLAAVMLLIGLVAVFIYWSGRESALRGGGLAVLLLLGALSSHISFNLNLRWPDEPVELLRPRSTSSDVRQLVSLLEGLSNDRDRYRYSVGITVDSSLAPLLPWYLRSFEQVRVSDVSRGTPDTPVVIAPVEAEPPLGQAYIGQRFRLETSWQFSAGSWRDRWRWYLFRLPPTEPLARDVVLYVGR